MTLSWQSFTDAADEAGISRRFGGIHFVDGDLHARKLGKKIGAHAWRKAVTYFNGTAGTPFDDSARPHTEDDREEDDEGS
jgi:hypothetical protein